MSPKSASRRLDVVVAEQSAISRERARALIMAGKVRVNGTPSLKLERALDEFGWPVTGLRCIDVGASTGGFTDCLLQRGARDVTAVDVGYGQIAWTLRTDPRVTVVERCNFRLADPSSLGAPFDFACADVAFISLAKLAEKFREVLADGARLVALVKPQFEAGRALVGRGGVVRDAAVHVAVVDSVASAFAVAGLTPVALTYSPILGPAGNIEFLIGAQAADSGSGFGGESRGRSRVELDVAGVVAAAHEALAR